MATDVREELYPEIEPYQHGTLAVSGIHTMYYEQSGNPEGLPVIFLHGGPGAGTSPRDRRFFDPEVYRIILMDQRGSGKSTPPGELRENTTWLLVSDIEKLREHLEIERWVVFGGSWGSTLALAYAMAHPDRVKAMVLRGIFTFTRKEAQWFAQEGCSNVFPDAYEKYIEPIPEAERGDLITAFYRRLTGEDEEEKLRCARAMELYDATVSSLVTDTSYESDEVRSLYITRILFHYMINNSFFETDGYLLNNIDKIRHIPCTIVQGRYDMVCPVVTAWELHKRFPEAEFHIVPAAAHSSTDENITRQLVKSTESYKYLHK